MEAVINFLEVITALLDEEHPFPARFLHRFSDLSLAEAKDLKAIWKEIDPVRRGALLTDLEEINDKDTLVNFESVALLGLKEADPIVRGTAIRLLENTDDRKVIPLFIALMHTDPDEKVRAEAAFAPRLKRCWKTLQTTRKLNFCRKPWITWLSLKTCPSRKSSRSSLLTRKTWTI
jgi:hypothetical protein